MASESVGRVGVELTESALLAATTSTTSTIECGCRQRMRRVAKPIQPIASYLGLVRALVLGSFARAESAT